MTNRPTTVPTEGPYSELLRNVPAVMREPLRQAYDAGAALAWLKQGRTPDTGAADGVDPQREHLKGIGADRNGERWIRWHGDVYRDRDEEVERFTTEIEQMDEPKGLVAGYEDRLPFRKAFVVVLARGRPLEPDGGGPLLPAGSYYAVVEYAGLNETALYQGLYRVNEDQERNWQPRPKRNERIWLNATAERVIVEVLTG